MRKAYVIGLSPANLLNIGWSFDFNGCTTKISSVIYGLTYVYDATSFDNLHDARDTVKQIQDRYEQISKRRDNIVDSLVHGNDFDPMQLRIYEVRVGWEVNANETLD